MLNSDLPIKKSSEDALNRTSFAESLAKVMVEYEAPEGFTIGMYGKWGSGKTSVINMVLEKVEEYTKAGQKPVILRFNPWLCSDPKQLIAQFFKQLSTAIKEEKPKLETVCKFIDNYAEVFEFAEAVPIAGSILSTIGKILGKKAKTYVDSQNNDLQKIKDGIIKTLSKEKIKIVIAIDDVDRLSNEEIISVFQLVKSLADFPYTIYLLAFDREVVIRALGDIQKGDGAEYLEKVIQVPFELPTPNIDRIHQLFFNKMNIIIADVAEDKWDKEYWGEMFHYGIKNYLSSIRDVVRYVNTFTLKYALLKDETNIIDLIGLTCIQVFEPDVYSILPNYKEQLCGSLGYYQHDTYQRETEKIKNAYNQITEGITDERKDNVTGILTRLFPKLTSVLNKAGIFGHSRYFKHYDSLQGGSICNSNCFERYFTLSLEDDAIPLQVIDYLLLKSAKEELLEGILKINSFKKTTRLLDHICAVFELHKDKTEYSDRAKMILIQLFNCWHLLEDNEDSQFFSTPFNWRLLSCTEKLLNTIKEAERLNVMRNIFADENVPLSTVIIELRHFESQHNRFTDEKSDEKDKLLQLEDVLVLESIFIERTVQEIESGRLLDDDSALYIIWFLEQLDENKTKEFAKSMINSDLDLAKFISASVTHGKGASRTVFKYWKVKKDNINKYIDINVAYERIKSFVSTNEFSYLDSNKQENVAAFLIGMETKDDSQRLDDEILISQIEKKLKEIKNTVPNMD